MTSAAPENMGENEMSSSEYCRRSKLAFDGGNLDKAGQFARRAIRLAPQDITILEFGSWLFSSIQWHDDAVKVLKSIERVRPLSAAQYAYISGILLKLPDYESAIANIQRAITMEPNNVSYRRHYATVLESCGRTIESALVLVEAVKANQNDASLFDQLSRISSQIGRLSEARIFATQAWSLDPLNFQLGRNLAHMLMTLNDYVQAASVLESLLKSGDVETVSFLMLSVALSQQQKYDEALTIATKGLELADNDVVLLMQQGAVLCCLAEYDKASNIFAKILGLSPEHEAARRGSFAALTEAGRYDEATAIGARLVSSNPDDIEIGRALQHVLTRRYLRSEDDATDGRALAELKRRNKPDRRIVDETIIRSLVIQLRVLTALILRELITRFGRSRLGYAWALFEPLAHISIMVALINGFAHGQPPIGDNFAVFYFTGIIPYHLFTHTAGQLTSAIAGNRAMLQLPIVTTVDVFISRGVLELLTEVSVALILFAGFLALGMKALPVYAPGVVLAIIQLWIVAFAVGILNAVIAGFFRSWERLWGALMSILYFSSGTFYIPEMMPENVRNVLSWNPVLQAIELVRTSYFHVPKHPWVSSNYLWFLGVILLALALTLERSFRRRIMASE